MITLVSLMVFFALLFVFLFFRSQKAERSQRVRRLLGASDELVLKEEGESPPWHSKLNLFNKLESFLLRAGINVAVYRFLGVVVVVAAFFFTLGLLITRSMFVSILLGMAGIFLVGIYVARQKNKRTQLIEGQLEDVVSLMANSLRAGASLAQAVSDVAQGVDEPSASEFKRINMMVAMGEPAAEALAQIADQLNSQDLKMVATASLVCSQSGGNLPEILDRCAETIRDRKGLRSSLKALTAEGKLSGIIIGIIPFVVAAAILLINPGYFGPMLSSPTGRIVLIAAFGMIFVGWYFIFRITSRLDF